MLSQGVRVRVNSRSWPELQGKEGFVSLADFGADLDGRFYEVTVGRVRHSWFSQDELEVIGAP